jgi:transcription elongation factor Elf1
VYSVGAMRELCPRCRTNHLKLVLRQKHVSQSHLFCEVCDQCFDARYLDGTSALAID